MLSRAYQRSTNMENASNGTAKTMYTRSAEVFKAIGRSASSLPATFLATCRRPAPYQPEALGVVLLYLQLPAAKCYFLKDLIRGYGM